ncbi:MliC family protein [Roseibium sp.]|uniref:MliC family protein n=2 Tax=Roseibium sp. TaxID=1936156 RepID=UPI003266C463
MNLLRALAVSVVLAAPVSTALASPDVDFPQSGKSYGGNVRAGPGTQYRDIGSLGDGTAIVIVNGTGVLMNGYEWFQIRYGNGKSGYQWGGLICSETAYPGILTTCARGLGNVQPPVTQGGGGVAISPGVSGFNVDQVFHAQGSFSNAGGGQWEELNQNGQVAFRFEERGRNEGAVFLYDTSRDVSLQLDLVRGQVMYGVYSEPKQPLYAITNAIADVQAQGTPSPVSDSVTHHYTCAEGLPLVVTYGQTGDGYAIFSIDGSPEMRLEQVRSGSGALYTDGAHSLHSKGNSVILTGPAGTDTCSE